MKWQKAPNELVEFFHSIEPHGPGIVQSSMFGYPCDFLNGNMFLGVYQDKIVLRLSEKDRKTFLELRNASVFEPLPGRIMKEYVVIPSDMLKRTATLKTWISKSIDYVSTLPIKTKNKKKK